MTIKVGSNAHKELFCRQFLESHELYDPAVLPWPELDDAQLDRLRSVLFWQEVYHTERRAGAIVAAFTPMVEDPLVREAVALQGVEEARHARLLRVMIDRYGLDATEQPLETFPPNMETAFIDFGFGKCMDSFLGFGAFKQRVNRNSCPTVLFEIFDVLMYEETRHIVFFINYMAWREVQRGRGAAPLRALTSAWYYGRALSRLLGMVRRGKNTNNGRDFAITEADMFLEGFSFRQFVEDCYRENGRRMSPFDPNLLQPRLLPAIAHMAVSGLRTWDRRRLHLWRRT